MNTSDNIPYVSELGAVIKKAVNGQAEVVAVVKEVHLNRFGTAHGGFIYSIADIALEAASNSHGIQAVAISTSIQYFKPLKNGAEVKAIATEVNLGKNTATYQVQVISEEQLIATFTGTVFRKHN